MSETSRGTRPVGADLVLAAAAGPLRTVVLSLGLLALYPFMLGRYGVDVVGLWSLLALVAGIPQFVDIGFSQLLLRDARLGVPRHQLIAVHQDYRAATTCYAAALIVMLIIVAAVTWFGALAMDTYPAVGVLIALTLLAIGVALTLRASLDAAVLAARRDATYVQVARGVTPLVSLAGAFVGVFGGFPLEGLAAGMTGSNAVLLLTLRRRLVRSHAGWTALATDSGFVQRLSRSGQMVRSGVDFYLASLGWGLRDPLFRLFVGATMGLATAAALDVAMRVGQAGRELVQPGFIALLPSFAALRRSGNREAVVALLQLALIALATSGALLFGSSIAMAPSILPLWLGKVPPGAIDALVVMCVWQFTVLLLIPFWHLLQATGHERVASRSVWIHTGSVLVLGSVGSLAPVSLTLACVFWTGGSVVMQAVLYRVCDARLHVLRPVVRDPAIAITLALCAGAMTASVMIAATVEATSSALLYLSVAQAPVMGAIFVIVAPRVKRMVREGNLGLTT